MELEIINTWAHERNLSKEDALQSFLQVIVLKNLTLEGAHLIGGTALVLGHGNPRFSEDLDFTNVKNPLLLENSLKKALGEIDGWLGVRGRIAYPKAKKSTWRLIYQFSQSETIQLHIDSQAYRAYTRFPMVIRFPGINPFVGNTVEIEEIMANKVVALGERKYLSGRDLFDLWFHWLSQQNTNQQTRKILDLLPLKLKERHFSQRGFLTALKRRLTKEPTFARAHYEWKRYLPPSFQKNTVFQTIIDQTKKIPEMLSL